MVPLAAFKLALRFERKSIISFLGLAISKKRGKTFRKMNRIQGGILGKTVTVSIRSFSTYESPGFDSVY